MDREMIDNLEKLKWVVFGIVAIINTGFGSVLEKYLLNFFGKRFWRENIDLINMRFLNM